MDDVLGHVVLGRGDEALDALDVPRTVGLFDRLGAACPDVRTRVGLGEHHGRAPVAVDHVLRDLLLVLVAVAVQDARERRARHIHVDRRVGTEHLLGDGPHDSARRHLTTQLGDRLETPPLAVEQRLVRLLERLGQLHRVRVRIEDRRVPVGVDERIGERAFGQLRDLVHDAARGLLVDVGKGSGAEDLVRAEDLEEVELDVADVALVVAHGRRLLISFGCA